MPRAGREGHPWSVRLGRPRRSGVDPCLGHLVRIHVVGQTQGPLTDPGDDLRDLDRGGDVVDEREEAPDTCQHEDERSGHGHLRHEGAGLAVIPAHRAGDGECEDEARGEDTQGRLGDAALQEAPEHPGGELAARELQHDHRDGEDEAGHRDHAGRDRPQQVARSRRAALEDVRQLGLQALVQERQGEPEGHRAHGTRRGYRPERPPHVVPPRRGLDAGGPAPGSGRVGAAHGLLDDRSVLRW